MALDVREELLLRRDVRLQPVGEAAVLGRLPARLVAQDLVRARGLDACLGELAPRLDPSGVGGIFTISPGWIASGFLRLLLSARFSGSSQIVL